MKTKRLTQAALLTAIALTIFMVEAQLPALAPIPGMKLGLANIVTVYAMFLLGPADTLAILLCRIVLGSLFAGQLMSMLYSLGGGLSCYMVMLLLRNLLTKKQIWVCGIIGAIAHNIGQICVAIGITRTSALLYYLPLLMVSGILTGCFTGLCAQFLTNRMAHMKKQNY